MSDATSLPPLRRVAIIGAGAMGSSLAIVAARFATVVMVVRNPQRAAQIFERGVECRGLLEGRANPLVVRSVADLEAVGGVGVVFIATKTTAIPQVCADLAPALDSIGESDRPVRIVSYQNGVEPGREIMQLLPGAAVLRMVLNYGATMDQRTGVVDVAMHAPPHAIGCLDAPLVPYARSLAARLSAADFPTVYDERIEQRVWEKAILNASMSPVAALVNSTIGEVLRSPSRRVVEHLLAESIAVAKADGIELPDDFAARAWAVFEKGAEHLPSMVHDIREGRESEVGQLNRQVLEHARRRSVPTPTHDTVDALIETFDWRVYQRGGAGDSDR
ncbi:MAG: ketopantoate reductase family protein [Phycisphaerales bacterium]